MPRQREREIFHWPSAVGSPARITLAEQIFSFRPWAELDRGRFGLAFHELDFLSLDRPTCLLEIPRARVVISSSLSLSFFSVLLSTRSPDVFVPRLFQVSFSYSKGPRDEWNILKIDGFDMKDDPKRYGCTLASFPVSALLFRLVAFIFLGRSLAPARHRAYGIKVHWEFRVSRE